MPTALTALVTIVIGIVLGVLAAVASYRTASPDPDKRPSAQVLTDLDTDTT